MNGISLFEINRLVLGYSHEVALMSEWSIKIFVWYHKNIFAMIIKYKPFKSNALFIKTLKKFNLVYNTL